MFVDELDSSCVIFLYTHRHFRTDRYRITQLMGAIAREWKEMGVSTAAITFDQLSRTYESRRSYMDCKSPTMLIIHDDDDTREKLEMVSRNIPMHEMTWIWYEDVEDLEDWFKHIQLPFSSLFAAAHQANESYVELRQIYRVAPGHPFHNDYYGFWSTEDSFLPPGSLFNWRHDLEGITLRTGSTQNPPVHSFAIRKDGNPELVGYFPEVWKELETILNFTSINYPSIDNVTGIIENGSWNGLIGMMMAGQIEVAVSEFILDSQRTHIVDFSRPLVRSNYQVFFRNVGDNLNWDGVLRPFDRGTWITILAWLILLTAVMSVVNYYGDRSGYMPEFNTINSFFFYLKTLCFQGHNIVPQKTSKRILYMTGYVVASVLYPAYSASLISHLTVRTPIRPFDSLQTLLDLKTYKLQTNAKTAEYTYFSEATDPTLIRIFEEMMSKDLDNYPLNTQDAFERLCRDPHLAHFGDMAVASTYLDHVRQVKKCDIVTLSQPMGTVYSSMAFPKYSPYRFVMNHFLQRMEDCGIIVRLQRRTIKNYRINFGKESISVNMYDVAQVFIMLIAGQLASLLILLCESVVFRWQKAREDKRKKVDDAFMLTSKMYTKLYHKEFIN